MSFLFLDPACLVSWPLLLSPCSVWVLDCLTIFWALSVWLLDSWPGVFWTLVPDLSQLGSLYTLISLCLAVLGLTPVQSLDYCNTLNVGLPLGLLRRLQGSRTQRPDCWVKLGNTNTFPPPWPPCTWCSLLYQLQGDGVNLQGPKRFRTSVSVWMSPSDQVCRPCKIVAGRAVESSHPESGMKNNHQKSFLLGGNSPVMEQPLAWNLPAPFIGNL